jgi:hypothetical protein
MISGSVDQWISAADSLKQAYLATTTAVATHIHEAHRRGMGGGGNRKMVSMRDNVSR